MRIIKLTSAVLLLTTGLAPALLVARAAPQKKEYLTDAEADKIRDAATTGPRMVLYMTFAGDRIKKLQYEFAHMDPADQKRTERLNNLINSYSGCVDDAADLLDIGVEKQEDIRDGVKAMVTKLKDFLPYLQDLSAKGPERETYKDNLDDAIEATQDALADVQKAAQEPSSTPVRRKPS